MTRQKRPLGRLRWGTKELGTVWRSLLDSALLPMTIFRYFPRSPSNGSSCRPQTPLRQSFILLFPTPPSNGGCSRATKPRGIIPQYNASVNSSCAQPPPPLPLGVYPQALAFFALDGKFPRAGTVELSNPPGRGRKKRANAPSSINTV